MRQKKGNRMIGEREEKKKKQIIQQTAERIIEETEKRKKKNRRDSRKIGLLVGYFVVQCINPFWVI